MSPTTNRPSKDITHIYSKESLLQKQLPPNSIDENKQQLDSHNFNTISTVDTKGDESSSIVHKRSAKDYIFGKVIGEGSYSTVYLAKDIHSNKEYAIKVCDKRHIIKEKKTEYIKREKEVLNILGNNEHFFVRLFCTFQDVDRLYFVLSYAKNGELLSYINKVGSFDIECTKFYSAEILRGLEYLHDLGIIHRDLKPENILLDEDMHILITDFGCSKILHQQSDSYNSKKSKSFIPNKRDDQCERRNSFVGTAQYASPELLTSKTTTEESDLWAFGCTIYQMLSGLPPFRARNEYLIFQKILALEYDIPDGFDIVVRDLVQKLLIIEPLHRLGATDKNRKGYPSIRAHIFFAGITFETLHEQKPPPIYPYLPATSKGVELRSHYRIPVDLKPGLDDKQLTRLLGLEISVSDEKNKKSEPSYYEKQKYTNESKSTVKNYELCENPHQITLQWPRNKTSLLEINEAEKMEKLNEQKSDNKWDCFVEGNLILKQGYVNKRKGLFSKRRMMLLTTGPHLYYVDPINNILKGEIPWSQELKVEPKNFKIFFVHTPDRTYYLEDPESFALEWCQAIEDVWLHYYGVN